jgi:SPP1 family predicted phage head-tail adaptor
MRAGKLRHTIVIERSTFTQNEFGEPILAWDAIEVVAASIEPLNGREYYAAQALQSEVTTKIRLRYLPGILPSDRVTHGAMVYDVLEVIDPEMRNIELVLMCKSSA